MEYCTLTCQADINLMDSQGAHRNRGPNPFFGVLLRTSTQISSLPLRVIFRHVRTEKLTFLYPYHLSKVLKCDFHLGLSPLQHNSVYEK